MRILLLLFTLVQLGRAQDVFYVVAHVDVPPPNTQKTIALLKQFAADTRKLPGLVRIDIQEENSMPNHFAIVSVWRDKASFEASESTAMTKKFRAELFPMLGAPLDMRPGHLLE